MCRSVCRSMYRIDHSHNHFWQHHTGIQAHSSLVEQEDKWSTQKKSSQRTSTKRYEQKQYRQKCLNYCVRCVVNTRVQSIIYHTVFCIHTHAHWAGFGLRMNCTVVFVLSSAITSSTYLSIVPKTSHVWQPSI